LDKILQKKEFYILKAGTEYIVVNSKKDFKLGHTHLRSYKSAVACVDFVIKGKIPKRCDFYYLTSLQRISTDERYINKIQELKETRVSKGRKASYYNTKKKG
jgi:hypothetical protein